MWEQDEDVDFPFVLFWTSVTICVLFFMFSKSGTIFLVKVVLQFDLAYIPLIVSQPSLLLL